MNLRVSPAVLNVQIPKARYEALAINGVVVHVRRRARLAPAGQLSRMTFPIAVWGPSVSLALLAGHLRVQGENQPARKW
jgi:hypothetical protein